MLKRNADVTVKNTDVGLKINIRGEIDHHSASYLREKIDKALYLYRPSVLVLDLRTVTFMDSSGLGLIAGRVDAAQEIGCKIRIENASREVIKILRISGADRLGSLTIEETKEKEKR